jgi:hypothetical protein
MQMQLQIPVGGSQLHLLVYNCLCCHTCIHLLVHSCVCFFTVASAGAQWNVLTPRCIWWLKIASLGSQLQYISGGTQLHLLSHKYILTHSSHCWFPVASANPQLHLMIHRYICRFIICIWWLTIASDAVGSQLDIAVHSYQVHLLLLSTQLHTIYCEH